MSETTTENQSKQRLIVKNFGSLKDVDIELKDIMVFIGPQASGKSTLAKILYIIHSFPSILDKEKLENLFKQTSINFFTKDTLIKYLNTRGKSVISCSSKGFEFDYQILDILDQHPEKVQYFKQITEIEAEIEVIEKYINGGNSIEENLIAQFKEVTQQIKQLTQPIKEIAYSYFIPAERNIISNLSDSIMGTLADGVSIPKFILNFGGKFEIARKELGKTCIDFLNVTYEYTSEDRVFISPEQSISLSEAASGLQSVVPLYLVVKHFSKNKCLVIEEPELNLFPETQKKLVEFIIETCRDKTKRLIITTHSPYILTTLNGLIQAHNTARTKPELKHKVAEIIPESRWIDFDKIGVYYVADGTVKRIMDDEYRLIDANPIDDVSDKLSREFDELLDLKYD